MNKARPIRQTCRYLLLSPATVPPGVPESVEPGEVSTNNQQLHRRITMEELLMAIKRKMEDFKFEADNAVTKGNK